MKIAALMSMVCLALAGPLAAQRGGGRTGGGHPAGGAHHGPSATSGIRRGEGRARFRGYGVNYGLGYGYGLGYLGLYDEPFYGYGSYPPPESGPNAVMAYPPPLPPAPEEMAPPVHPVIHEYRRPEDYGGQTEAPPPPMENESSPVLYLIAFRDKNIRAASTYWINDGTLYYLDEDHKEVKAPLASVDRDLSARLNRERNVPFNLP
ncbi:MAG TPA: hypothetical protein VMI94_15595 [Bryobacteraceae bacterium]|nr:hypothetical protein [Bryobacteraceae bacterium]